MMIFYIDDGIADIARQTPPPAYFLSFVEELFRARRLGRLIIFCRIATLEALEEMPGLSARTLQVIRKVRGRQRFKKKLFESVTVYVKVVPEEGILQKKSQEGRQVIEISAQSLVDGGYLDEVNLLVENFSDADLYLAIADLVNFSLDRSQFVRNKFSVVPGGGSQTPRVYKELKKRNELSFCIVDGDVEFLYGALGGNTARPISAADALYPVAHAESLVLDCYSIENLIPPKWIRAAVNQSHISPPWFEVLERHHRKDFWPFLTLKRGKKCGEFYGDYAGAVYWRRYLDDFSPLPDGCDSNGGCNSNCFVLQKMSEDTLVKVVDYLEKVKEREGIGELAQMVDDLPVVVRGLWGRIAENVTSWGCVGEKIAAL